MLWENKPISGSVSPSDKPVNTGKPQNILLCSSYGEYLQLSLRFPKYG
jgi:hypothetical protein